MSGLVGRGSRSFKKKIVEQSLIPALGIKKVRFAHENGNTALAANATIQFNIFSPPAEMTALGFSNPSSTEIINLRMGEFRNNVIVESNLNGVLIDQLAYTITNSAITFINDYVVDANEIFILNIGSNPVTGNRIVDARPLRASGGRDGENMFADISARPIDFSTGQGFRVASSTVNSDGEDNQQIGNVQVFVNGVLQIRNDGNSLPQTLLPAAMQSGNYAEVALSPTGTVITGVDYANAIRFNQFNNYNTDDGVLVVATNLIVDEPNGTGLDSLIQNNTGNIASNVTNIATNTAGISANTTAIANVSSETVVPTNLLQSVFVLSPNRENRLGGSGRSTIFSYTEATWICPTGVNSIFIEMAGGGTSGNTAATAGGTNGFPGQWYQSWHSVVAGQTYNIRLGNPGAGSTTSGQGENGGPTRFEGTIDSRAGANIDTGVAKAPEGPSTGTAGQKGTVTVTNLNAGPQTNLGSDTTVPVVQSGHAWLVNNPAAFTWNSGNMWTTPGDTGSSGTGGSTPVATGGAFVSSDGGGGAGFENGSAGNSNSGRGGAGGIRITYYSETPSVITIGNNVING